MSADEGFLRAILDASEDDTPRLVYADWLDEHGRSEIDRDRAEFIRAQCALAKLDEASPRRRELGRRADELRRRNQKAWTERLPELEGITWYFERGFPDTVRARSYRVYHLHEEELFRVAPVRRLAFGSMRSPAKLAASPGLARLSALELRGTALRDDGVVALAASPHLRALHRLRVSLPWKGPERDAISTLRERFGEALEA